MAPGSVTPHTLCGWSQIVPWVLSAPEGWVLAMGAGQADGAGLFLVPMRLPRTSCLSPRSSEVVWTSL